MMRQTMFEFVAGAATVVVSGATAALAGITAAHATLGKIPLPI